MIPEIREATRQDAYAMAAIISAEDRRELAAMGQEALPSMLEMLARPGKAYAWLVDGQPVMLFGVNSTMVLADSGMIWIAVSEAAKRHTPTMLRHWRPYLAELERGYTRLETTVLASLTSTVKWMRRAGFTICGPLPLYAGGELFYYCYKECASCQ